MKRAFAGAAVLALALTAAPAFAQDLQGSGVFGACTVTPLTLERVKRDDPNDRWAKVRALVECTEEYAAGETYLTLRGIKPDGTWGVRRGEVREKLGTPVTIGEHLVKGRIQCNWKTERGVWRWPRHNLLVQVAPSVSRPGFSWGVAVVDRTTVSC